MDKYRPETKEAKLARLKQRAADKAEGKVSKIFKLVIENIVMTNLQRLIN